MPAAIHSQLLLMRHGKSDWPEDTADFDRPLTARGERDARKIGAWLKQQGLKPGAIVSSPAVRARDTAMHVAAELDEDSNAIVWEPAVYEASLPDLCAVIERYTKNLTSLLIIGHNPGLDSLLYMLSRDEPQRTASGKLMTTATLAILEYDSVISTGMHSARLHRLVRPKSVL